jgi:hypothetical protein
MHWQELHDAVARLKYKPGWRFRLVTDYTWSFDATIEHDDTPAGDVTQTAGLAAGHSDLESPPMLVISALVADSSATAHDCPHSWCGMPHGMRGVDAQHAFFADVKHRDQDHRFWRRWLLECIFLVEKHEAMEHFEQDGFKTFYPAHGPGQPLYTIEDKTP